MQRRQPSISDVATAAGVSIATVSRVLNDPKAVGEVRRAAVLEAMDRLQFRPSVAARTLATGRSRTIALVASDTALYGYTTAMQGVEEAARRSGYATIITVVDSDDPAHVQAAVDVTIGQSVAGVIGLEFDMTVARALRAIPRHVPMAVAAVSGSEPTSRPSLHVDDALGTLRATNHLLKLGHETVHYFVVPDVHFDKSGRMSGWRNGLRAADVEVPAPIVTSWSPEDAYAAARREYRPEMTAILCHNDEIAMGVMSALADLGLRVPEDVSVIGMDDHPLSRIWRPQLTTVGIDFHGLGQQAFDLLKTMLDGGEPPADTWIEPTFVVRSSTARARS